MDGRCDKDLVMASCRGDRPAYANLVRRHHNHVFLVCLGVLGNVHDAEDVAQEAMLKGFERIRQLRDGAQFGAWVAKIARNLSVTVLRRRRGAERAAGERSHAERPAADPGHEGLQGAIAQLPLDLRLPLVMYYFDGQNVKTVARHLDISTSGVYLKLRTAIRELHDILTTQGEAR
ncbi:MAG: RNA polymerase sigma factor [Sedimentisphaerales bacterium]|nr:RNA polymerase sigma factor [Sedimentisphaerales bacterium]